MNVKVIFLQTVLPSEGWMAVKGQLERQQDCKTKLDHWKGQASRLYQQLRQIQIHGFSSRCPHCLACPSTFVELLLILRTQFKGYFFLLVSSELIILSSLFPWPVVHSTNSTFHSVQ